MNKLNRKAAETDLMDMKLVPLSEVAEGFCRHRKNNGEPCKRRAVVMGVCPSHLQSIGGHIFVTDRHAPEFPGWDEKRYFSYCRACGELESDGHTLELCPVRRVNPDVPYPPSPRLPNRLQYQFARPARATIALNGKRINATCCGPIVAYRIEPDAEGLTWEVFHLPSRSLIAHLDSEKASIKLMREICHDGVELDFKDPMKMDHAARFHINLVVTHGGKGKFALMPGGILAWNAEKPYFRTRQETSFYWMKEESKEKIECWGPFGFVVKDSEVFLHSLDEPFHGPLFRATSREQAIAFSKAATALNLNWRERCSKESRYYPETLRGIEKLIADFHGAIRPKDGLLPPQPPPPPEPLPKPATMPDLAPTEISIATTEGPLSVSAYVIAEHFAVHRPIDYREHGYVLTHLPTGYQIGRCNNMQTCLDVIPELASLGGWNFANPRLISSKFEMQVPETMKALNRHGINTGRQTGTIRIM